MNNNQLKKNIIIIISIIMCLTFLYLIASFIFHIDSPSSEGMSWLAIITSIIAMVYIISSTNHIYGHSLAFIVYLIFTQFGTCIAVYAFKLKTLNTNSYHVTGWITSASYPYAVQLGIIAVIVLSFSVVLSGKYFRAKPYIGGHAESQKAMLSWIGNLLLIICMYYIIYMILTGKFLINGNYIDFLLFSKSYIRSWSKILVLLQFGFAFVFAVGTQDEKKKMIFLYFVISVILLVTGNKGEVLYTLLAAFGVFCYKKNRLQIKIIVIGLCIVFIMIPTITTLRNTGVINSLGKISVSISDPLVEMGYQIRLSVFMIDGISNGSRSLLYGFSYYNPIVNIINRFIPMIPRIAPPSQYDFFTTYDTMGFSQVAESYANYGVMGVVLFHIVIGVILAKFDNTNKNDPIMALNMCVLIVFIIMIRNAFNFVLGQILIAYILWMACMQLGAYTKIKHIKHIKYKL